MYFVYQKQINVASEYSYDVDSIVEWFKNYIDLNDIIEAYGEEVTAKDVVDDIFSESDSWYDDFIQNFDIESDVVDNMYSEDIAEKYDVFEALANLCTTYCEDIPEESDDYAQFVIDWLKDNLEDYIDEFLSILRYITSTDYNTEGGIDNDNITELLDNEEFMKEFRQYLSD